MVDWETFFSEGGLLSREWKGFKYRKGQEEMARVVMETLDEGGVAVIEAGTGTGKSLAYLAGAVKASWERDEPVVVSTPTKNLQNQILHHEVPLLQGVLPRSFKVTLLKGRQNYLCLFRLHWAANRRGADRDAVTAVLEWSRETGDGDLERSPFAYLSPVVGSSGEYCLSKRCPYHRRCFYFRAIQSAAKSQVVVVNHHLLLHHLLLEGTALPETGVLVVDEAHKIERVAMEVLGVQVDLGRLVETVEGLTKKKSLLAGEEKEVLNWLSPVKGMVLNLSRLMAGLWSKNGSNLEWEKVNNIEIEAALKDVVHHLDKAVMESELLVNDMEPEMATQVSLDLGFRDLVAYRNGLKGFLSASGPGDVRWVEPPGVGIHPTFRLIRVGVAEVLSEALFNRFESVLLTSATLTVGGSFDYLRRTLGIPHDARELVVESPFDWKRQMEVVLFSRAPDPKDEGYFNRLLSLLEGIVAREGGGTLCLFTATGTMRQMGEALKTRLPHLSWYIQGDAPRNLLQQEFTSDPKGVLLGVASFWEGVDMPGDALRSLVLVKLPFRSPDEPVVKAISRFLKSQGLSPFNDFSLPDAVILFKQGVGRLIRTENDHGRVYILDPRVVKKGYGRFFLRSLPQGAKVIDGEEIQ